MRVAIRKIEGVASVEVSLERGLAVVAFRPQHEVTVERVREAIRRQGFAPKDAEVRIRGRVTEASGRLLLSVPGAERAFALVDDPAAAGVTARLRESARGRTVVVEGTLPESTRERPAEMIRVRSFALPPGT